MKNLRDELEELYLELGIIQKEYCEKEEVKQFKDREVLPEGVHEEGDGNFYRYVKTDLSKDEIEELLMCRQIYYLKSIKFDVTFFVVLAVIGLLLGLFIGLAGM